MTWRDIETAPERIDEEGSRALMKALLASGRVIHPGKMADKHPPEKLRESADSAIVTLSNT